MNVFQRIQKGGTGDPIWYVSFTDPVTRRTTKRSLKGATRRQEAERAAIALLVKRETEISSGKPLITIQAALDDYVDALRSEQKASAREAASLRNKLLGLAPFEGRWHLDASRKLHTFSPLDATELVRARRAEGNGSQTISHELKLMRAATRHAAGSGYTVNRDMIDGNIKNAWRMPSVAIKTRYLSLDEFQKVYDWLSPERPLTFVSRRGRLSSAYVPKGMQADARRDAQDLFVALTMCGGRWSEVASLRWDRVDLPALKAWQAWRAGGDPKPDTRPNVTMTVWGNKTQSERMLGCPDAFCEVLCRRLEERREGDIFILGLPDGQRRGATCRAITRAFAACGLNTPERVAEAGKATIHSLRHTFASILLQHGAGLSMAV
jgi:integrase